MGAKTKPLIGISACLSGEAVRYDSGHKRQPLLLSLLSPRADLLPFCPEVAAGLGVPRPPVQLIETTSAGIRAVGVEDGSLDVTTALEGSAREFLGGGLDGLSGFILKSRSPSCGLGSTPIHDQQDRSLRLGNGVFAGKLRQAAPWLPLVEESALDSEEHCLRFLSACVLVARHRYGMAGHSELESVLMEAARAPGLSRDQRLNGVVQGLLARDSGRENKKAALDERLSEYWRKQS